MTASANNPYSKFKFVVSFAGQGEGPSAGFEECSLVGIRPLGAADPAGQLEVASAGKIGAVHKVGDVTLKRGVISASALNDWLKQVREGAPGALRTVSVELWNPLERSLARRWKLMGASIKKFAGPTLSAKGTDVAIEELVLSCEGLEIA